ALPAARQAAVPPGAPARTAARGRRRRTRLRREAPRGDHRAVRTTSILLLALAVPLSAGCGPSEHRHGRSAHDHHGHHHHYGHHHGHHAGPPGYAMPWAVPVPAPATGPGGGAPVAGAAATAPGGGTGSWAAERDRCLADAATLEDCQAALRAAA